MTANNTGAAYSENNWSTASWQNTSYIRQGAGDTARYIGAVWFDTSGLPSGTKTVKSAVLTIKRNSDAGGSRPVSVVVFSNNVTKGSTNPYLGKGTDTSLGIIYKGDISPFSNNSLVAIAQAIVNGTANAICFYAPNDTPTGVTNNFSANWARFDGVGESAPPTLTITYEA